MKAGGETRTPRGRTTSGLVTIGLVIFVGVGLLQPSRANHVKRYAAYVIDFSSGTAGAGGACGDTNLDGNSDTILDCEIKAALNVNQNTRRFSSVSIGAVGFAAEGVVADVSPAAGIQPRTFLSADANENNTKDLDEVSTSLTNAGFSEFTPMTATSSQDLDAGLEALNSLVDTLPADATLTVTFLSPGGGSVSSGPGSPLQDAADRGIVINTFSFSEDCSSSALGTISDGTGGHCFEVAGSSNPLEETYFSFPLPDSLIKRSTDSSYIGNDVYNTTGKNQTRSWTIRRGNTRVFNLDFEDDAFQESLLIRGSGSTRKFKVTYLKGSTNITDHIAHGTYVSKSGPMGDHPDLRVKIKATSRASVRDIGVARVTAISATDGSTADVVQAKVKVVK